LKILFTPSGRTQFLSAIAYIHRDNPGAALAFRDEGFFYRVKNKTIWIVAVWHSAQLPGEPKEKNA
jgi:hypothetical protein